MKAEVSICIHASTVKKLLLGLTELEAVINYDGDGYDIVIDEINMDPHGGKYDVYVTSGLDSTRKIQCIKDVRTITGDGLKEAKEKVEAHFNGGENIFIGRYDTKMQAIQAIDLLSGKYHWESVYHPARSK